MFLVVHFKPRLGRVGRDALDAHTAVQARLRGALVDVLFADTAAVAGRARAGVGVHRHRGLPSARGAVFARGRRALVDVVCAVACGSIENRPCQVLTKRCPAWWDEMSTPR